MSGRFFWSDFLWAFEDVVGLRCGVGFRSSDDGTFTTHPHVVGFCSGEDVVFVSLWFSVVGDGHGSCDGGGEASPGRPDVDGRF